MLPILVRLHVSALLAGRAVHRRLALLAGGRLRQEGGQTSAEYALVLLGAATVALLIALWAKNTDALGNLLDSVFDTISGMVR